MLILFNNLSLNSYKRLCRYKNIKYVSRFNKNKLKLILNEYNSSKYIQCFARLKTMRENTCPILQEKLKYPFISFKVDNSFFYYDFKTIIDYFNKSNNFVDPCTRRNISDKKIEEINKLIRYYYGKNTNKILISDTMRKNTELNIIIYCLYNIVTDINREILSIDNIYNYILPRLIYYLRLLSINQSRIDYETIVKATIENIECLPSNRIIIDYLNLALLTN